MELDEYLAQQRKERRRNKHPERDEQMHFVTYVRALHPRLPMWMCPIFKYEGTALQRAKQGATMRRMGYTKGTPDLTFLISRKCYSGLVLEFKMPGNKPDADQEEILKHCKDNGKSVHVVYSCAEAIKIFDWYMAQI